MDKSIFKFDSNTKQRKIIKGTIIFLVTLFIGIIIYSVTDLIINADKTANIEILVAPSDAKVEIDGKSYSTKANIRIKPGTYAVKIEKDGFISFNGSITANADETSYLYEFLNEQDENGTYYKDNENEAGRAQQVSDKKADIFHETYNGTDNIWNVTPYDNYQGGYKIYAEKDESGNPIIKVYLYTCSNDRLAKLKDKALEYLEEQKIDLKKYKIEYSNCN
jgi:hypothetical protein